MSAWHLPIAYGVLILACVLMGIFGADSRPGFADGKVHYKERWFFHSRHD